MKEIMKISEFLSYKYDAAFCEEIVRMTSLENMKKAEQERPSDFPGTPFRKGQEGIIREGSLLSGRNLCFSRMVVAF